MTTEAKQQAIDDLRRDATDVERAADVLYRRGAMKLSERVRKTAREWFEQVDEMERRA